MSTGELEAQGTGNALWGAPPSDHGQHPAASQSSQVVYTPSVGSFDGVMVQDVRLQTLCATSVIWHQLSMQRLMDAGYGSVHYAAHCDVDWGS